MDGVLICAAPAAPGSELVDAFQRGATALGTQPVCSVLGNALLATHGRVQRATQGAVTRIAYGDISCRQAAGTSFEQWVAQGTGNFAAFEFDADNARLHAARDRFGAVPVYYTLVRGALVASTRLASLLPFVGEVRLDTEALGESLRFRWLSGHATPVKGVSQLGAGQVLAYSGTGAMAIKPWWTLEFRGDGPPDPALQSRLLRTALSNATRQALSAARSPGVLLSGGVDSSVIAAVARELRPDVRCFIAVLAGDDDTELGRARYVAKRLGLPLDEIPFDRDRLSWDLRRVVKLLEEPPRNPNNLVLMQLYDAMASRGVDVALNGDGPEMLLGLADSRRVARFAGKQRLAARLPGIVRSAAARLLRTSDNEYAWRLARVLGDGIQAYAQALDEIQYALPVQRALRNWRAYESAVVPHANLLDVEPAHFDDGLHRFECANVLLSSQRRHESLARSVGITAITPFLHPQVLDFAAQLPREFRYTDRSRPVLKRLCDELVHVDVARWEKLGFPVPWGKWLREELASEVGTGGDYAQLEPVLPPGFVSQAFATMDPEALWTLATLRIALHNLSVAC